jgi:large subunit ribosomal protein L25
MQLPVQTREKFGKSVKTLREQGLIPAELYGRGINNVHLAVEAKQFKKIFREAGENTVIDLALGKEPRKALIHGVQRNPVSQEIEHIDFYQVRMDETITAKVPFEFAGEAPAVKEYGGILNRTMNEIEVEALPGDLPHSIQVDLAELKELNQSVYVKDLKLPRGVEVTVDPETVIVTVAEPMKEEEAAPAPAADVSAVKVETEEKKAEREKEGEGEAA